MQLIHQQISAVAQQQLAQQLSITESLSNTAFDSVERLISLQFQFVRQFFDHLSHNTKNLYPDHGIQPHYAQLSLTYSPWKSWLTYTHQDSITPISGGELPVPASSSEKKPVVITVESVVAEKEVTEEIAPLITTQKNQQLALLDTHQVKKVKTTTKKPAVSHSRATPAETVKVSKDSASKKISTPKKAAQPQKVDIPVSAPLTKTQGSKNKAVSVIPAKDTPAVVQEKTMPAFPFATPKLASKNKADATPVKADSKPPVANKKAPAISKKAAPSKPVQNKA